MRELIDISAKFQSSQQTLEEMYQKVSAQDEEVVRLLQRPAQFLSELNDFRRQT